MTTTMSPWARTGVYIFGGILFAAGIGMSGYFLAQLAEQFGIPAPFSYLLPAALDAGAIVGVFMWVTGAGEVEEFGRRTARLLFCLSIVGNGLERALTFGPDSAAPDAETGLTRLIERTTALAYQLGAANPEGAPTPGLVEVVSTWFLLAVSVGIGVVFPILAYQMGHGIILARKSQDTPGRAASRRVQDGLVKQFARKLAEAPAAAEPEKAPAPTAAPALPPAAPVPAARTPRPEPAPAVQDSGTGTATEVMDAFILAEWDAGRAVTGADADRYAGTDPKNGLGRKRLGLLRREYPGREPAGTPAGQPVTAPGTATVPARVNGTAVPELVGTASGR